jgi:hypothetical protein
VDGLANKATVFLATSAMATLQIPDMQVKPAVPVKPGALERLDADPAMSAFIRVALTRVAVKTLSTNLSSGPIVL